MGKRFTDTAIWNKKWFRKLSAAEKCAWFYIKDLCDSVGVWDADTELAEYSIGEKVDWQTLQTKVNGNIEMLPNDKYFLVDFCDFQYGELNEKCKPHAAYILKLKKHGLLDRVDCVVCGPGENSYNGKRSRVTESKKNKIFKRDNYTCQYCGNIFEKDQLVIDHVIPLSKNGAGEDYNLVTACVLCNASKSDSMPLDFIEKKGFKPLQGIYNALNTLQEKEQEKEKEKDLEKEKEQEKERAGKVKYADHVSMTEEEYKILVQKNGQDVIDAAIEKLDAYKLSGGKRYKSDAGALRSWAIRQVLKDKLELSKAGPRETAEEKRIRLCREEMAKV